MVKGYLKAVKSEIRLIKKHATDAEKSKLSIISLDPISISKCIYGLMTGDCYSNRAMELIRLCADKDLCFSDIRGDELAPVSFSYRRYSRNYTPLEHYINCNRENNKHILAFIKGETNKLELK